jgi:STE24 endopeptidase
MAHPLSTTFSILFLLMLALVTAARLWLSARQLHHVAAHRAEVPAAFADTLSLEAHQRAADYTAARIRHARRDLMLGALVLLGFTLGGGLNFLHQLAAKWFAPGSLAHGLTFIGAVVGAGALIDLPLSLYRTFGIEARFGFNRTTWRVYLADSLKGLVLALVIGAPLLYGVLWLLGAMGERAWFFVWLFWSAFNLLAMFLYPTFIAPLFNTFTPLADAALQARIEDLLKRCGFAAKGLFVMDGSRRSSHGNAYFTGFGRARRIVFFDTLLARLSPPEIEAVLAHELGHFHHRHILKRLVMMFSGSLALMWGMGQLFQQRWFFEGLGMGAQDMASALTLFMLVAPVFLFPLTPILSVLSRRDEFQADAFAAAKTSATDLSSALLKLYRDNAATLTPDPLYSAVYDSHPPAAARIAHLQSLKA